MYLKYNALEFIVLPVPFFVIVKTDPQSLCHTLSGDCSKSFRAIAVLAEACDASGSSRLVSCLHDLVSVYTRTRPNSSLL